MNLTIQETGVEEAALVFEWVLRLLRELGDEADVSERSTRRGSPGRGGTPVRPP